MHWENDEISVLFNAELHVSLISTLLVSCFQFLFLDADALSCFSGLYVGRCRLRLQFMIFRDEVEDAAYLVRWISRESRI